MANKDRAESSKMTEQKMEQLPIPPKENGGSHNKAIRPSKESLEAAVMALQQEIETLKAESTRCKEGMDKIQGAKDGKKDETDAAKNVLNILTKKKKELMDARLEIVTNRDAAKAVLDDQIAQEKALRAELTYSSAQEIDAKIKELETRQSTTSMSLAAEKLIIAEIKKLQQMKKSVSSISGLREVIEREKAQRTIWDKQYSQTMAAVKAIGDQIDQQRAVLDAITKNCANAAGGDSFASLKQKQNDIRDEINKKTQAIKDLRNEFKQKEDLYYKGIKEERQKQKEERDKEIEARRAQEDLLRKERDAEELLRPPYEAEISMCDFLATYLRNIQRTATDGEDDNAEGTVETTKLVEGHGMKVLRRDLEDYCKLACKPRGKKKGGAKCSTDKIKHGVDTIEFFSSLALTPPGTQADIASSLEALTVKKSYFETLERGAIKSISDTRKERDREAAKEAMAARDKDWAVVKASSQGAANGHSNASNGNTSTGKTNGAKNNGANGLQEQKEKKVDKKAAFSLEADFPSLSSAPEKEDAEVEEQK